MTIRVSLANFRGMQGNSDSGIQEIFACGIRNLGKFCLWNPKSWALESRIQLRESGIPLTIGIQKPSSTEKDSNPVPGIRNPRRGIQKPRLSWIPLHGAKFCTNHPKLSPVSMWRHTGSDESITDKHMKTIEMVLPTVLCSYILLILREYEKGVRF